MRELFDLVAAVADSEANVLIQGENGTGKELIANALHYNCRRDEGPVHQDQLRGDSEGPDRVGAVRLPARLVHGRDQRQGRPARAGAGRLAAARRDRRDAAVPADEAAARAAGARVPAGRQRSRHPRGLPADLRDQRGRRGRAARTAGCARTSTSASTRSRLRVPALRERTEDIPLLCDHFLDRFRQRYQRSVRTIAPSAYHLLIRCRWQGNVRELENAIERAVLVAKGIGDHAGRSARFAAGGRRLVGRLRDAGEPHAGRDRADDDRAGARADELEQAGSGGAARSLSPDAVQQDAESTRFADEGRGRRGAARAAGRRACGRAWRRAGRRACVIGPPFCWDSSREPSSAARRAGSS